MSDRILSGSTSSSYARLVFFASERIVIAEESCSQSRDIAAAVRICAWSDNLSWLDRHQTQYYLCKKVAELRSMEVLKSCTRTLMPMWI